MDNAIIRDLIIYETRTYSELLESPESGKAIRPVLEELGRWAHANLKEFHDAIVSIDDE